MDGCIAHIALQNQKAKMIFKLFYLLINQSVETFTQIMAGRSFCFLDPVGSLVSTLWVVGRWLVVVTLFLNL